MVKKLSKKSTNNKKKNKVVFTEEVYARDYKDAKETATARNPKARVIGVNPIVGG